MPPRPTPKLRLSSINRALLVCACLAGFAALPMAQFACSASFREASTPAEESLVCCTETALQRRVEWRGCRRSEVASHAHPCCTAHPRFAADSHRFQAGHRWSNGLLAPLRT